MKYIIGRDAIETSVSNTSSIKVNDYKTSKKLEWEAGIKTLYDIAYNRVRVVVHNGRHAQIQKSNSHCSQSFWTYIYTQKYWRKLL